MPGGESSSSLSCGLPSCLPRSAGCSSLRGEVCISNLYYVLVIVFATFTIILYYNKLIYRSNSIFINRIFFKIMSKKMTMIYMALKKKDLEGSLESIYSATLTLDGELTGFGNLIKRLFDCSSV